MCPKSGTSCENFPHIYEMGDGGGAFIAYMAGAFMTQMGGTVWQSELSLFERYAQKTLVFRGVPFPVIA